MDKLYFVRSALNTFVCVDSKSFNDFITTFELLHPDFVVNSSQHVLASHHYEYKRFSCSEGEFAYIVTDLDYLPFS